MIYPYAGDGHEGYVGDGGLASTAEFGWDTTDTPPVSGSLVAVDHYLYVSDSRNNRIRRIDLETTMIECVAGSSATEGYTGDGGAALDATFAWPLGLALGPDGRLYVADRDNNVVRAIDLTTGVVETVVGDGTLCDTAVSACPDRAPALAMELNQPYGVGFDGDGNLYVADTLNSRVIKVVR
jgi:DNA-binding beta-propeller fold protein YncE